MSGWNWLSEGNRPVGNDAGAGPAVVIARVARGSSSWWRGDKDTPPVRTRGCKTTLLLSKENARDGVQYGAAFGVRGHLANAMERRQQPLHCTPSAFSPFNSHYITCILSESLVQEPAVLLGESMPSQLTTEYLSSKYGDTVVPLEINSPKKTLVKLGDYLQVKQLQTRGRPRCTCSMMRVPTDGCKPTH